MTLGGGNQLSQSNLGGANANIPSHRAHLKRLDAQKKREALTRSSIESTTNNFDDHRTQADKVMQQ